MAPNNREIVVYYDFGDVIQSSSTVSSVSMIQSMDERGSLKRSPSPLKRSSSPLKRSPSPLKRSPFLRKKSEKTDDIEEVCDEHDHSSTCSDSQFDFHHYDNVEHEWDEKPFLVKTIKTFPLCGASHNKMNSIIAKTIALLKMLDCWEPEALVLTDAHYPFRSKIFFAVQNVGNLARNSKIVYLSGLWLSKVFVGNDEDLVEWIDAVESEVQEKYSNKRAAQTWFAQYPTKAQHPHPDKYAVVTFFVKVCGC